MNLKRLLFACYHFYLDPSNGAAITAREILQALVKRGWEVSTFCGCGLDFQKPEGVLQLLADRNISPQQIVESTSGVPFSMAHFLDGSIRSTVFLPRENQHIPSREAGRCYLRLLREIVKQFTPDILVTYGGYWLGKHLLSLSRQCGLANVLLLQNLAYSDLSYFRDVDLTIVPSQFASDWYTKKLGIASTPIPPMMDWSQIRCEDDKRERKYLTFVNPEPGKGVYLFAQVAKQLWERRPDIPLLVVEGRAGGDWLSRTGVDLRGVKNISLMANTPDPRDFYRVSKIAFMPSLFMESFGRIAAEAMINGVPVIASNRGALPEVIGDAGLTLEIPAQYAPEARVAPTTEEAEPWVDAIVKLWDDARFYESLRQKSLDRAERWRPEIIAEQYDNCLSRLGKRE
jgi:glycosyltransferase involved in cell wall biosynthesis